MVYFVSAKVDHFSESGLLFSVVAHEEMGIDYSAKNTSSILLYQSGFRLLCRLAMV